VALWLPNVPAYVELFVACCHLGAVAVAVNTRFRSVEVGDIVGRTGATVLAFWPHFKGIDFPEILRDVDPQALAGLKAVVALDDAGEVEYVPGAATIGYDALLDHAPIGETRAAPGLPCKIFTTSGTTSGPKFVLHDQGTSARHGRDAARALGCEAPDVKLLQVVPLCGVFGFAQLMVGLAAGRPSVLLEAFDAERAAELIVDHGITHTNGADDMIDRLLQVSASARPFPSLRRVGYAKFNPAMQDLVERADAAGVTMVGVYGMSECMALFSAQPPDAPVEQRKLGGGYPVSDAAEVRIRDADTGELLSPGENGQIEIRAPSVMLGYFGNAAATRDVFTDDGFLRTGDLGCLTGDGGFTFLNRAGDALRLGGFLVNPQEIESHMLTHPAVTGCQVVGAEEGTRTRAVAFVTLEAGRQADEADLIAHCTGRLARFKVPARVIPVEAFPVTQSANGVKIQRGKLRERAQAELDRTGGSA
jgi:fatty-acyl-CoA synthase